MSASRKGGAGSPLNDVARAATPSNNRRRNETMPKTNSSVAKLERFGVPSLETCTRISNEDNVRALQASHYRLTARMRELELQFEEKAAELRQAFLDECAQTLNGSEEE
jgi:hypothetical protein